MSTKLRNKGTALKEPRPTVLFEPNAVVSTKVRAAPNTWFLVGGGDKDRLGVLSQTGYRIRRGLLADFPNDDGHWQVVVSSNESVAKRLYPVEVYLRWVPVAEREAS